MLFDFFLFFSVSHLLLCMLNIFTTPRQQQLFSPIEITAPERFVSSPAFDSATL